jgi:transcriptional antiterminator
MPAIPISVVINQYRYRSIHDAAQATGYSENTIRRRLKKAESIYLTDSDFASIKRGPPRALRSKSSEPPTEFSWSLVYRLLGSPTEEPLQSPVVSP